MISASQGGALRPNPQAMKDNALKDLKATTSHHMHASQIHNVRPQEMASFTKQLANVDIMIRLRPTATYSQEMNKVWNTLLR